MTGRCTRSPALAPLAAAAMGILNARPLDASETVPRLLESVPRRPLATDGPSATAPRLVDNPRGQMLGLLAKYNWQFRRPYPQRGNVLRLDQLDGWRPVATDRLDANQVQIFSGHQYHIDLREFRETFIWAQENVDWTAAVGAPSSMLVPTTVGYHYVRTVTGICFPSLCWVLRRYHTAEEIETAWLHMPLLRPGKSNRGTQGRQKKGKGKGKKM